MTRGSVDRTREIYKCNTYCQYINSNTTCTEFSGDILSECIAATAHCDCRPAWKQPVVWIVAGSFAFAFILMIRDFVIRLMNRSSRIQRNTIIAQPIVSTIASQFAGAGGGATYNTQHHYVAATPMPTAPMQQWNLPSGNPPSYMECRM